MRTRQVQHDQIPNKSGTKSDKLGNRLQWRASSSLTMRRMDLIPSSSMMFRTEKYSLQSSGRPRARLASTVSRPCSWMFVNVVIEGWECQSMSILRESICGAKLISMNVMKNLNIPEESKLRSCWLARCPCPLAADRSPSREDTY